jgi:hypothetical protein
LPLTSPRSSLLAWRLGGSTPVRPLPLPALQALDKIRYESLTDPAKLGAETELKITIVADKAAGTLTIEDTGACGRETHEWSGRAGAPWGDGLRGEALAAPMPR